MRQICTILAILLTTFLHAQEKKVSGRVLDKSSRQPLAGVTIAAKKQVVATDSMGRFSIVADANEQLTISYVGMQTITLKAAQADLGDIELALSGNDLNEIVVTGYQTQKKADLTGSVSVVDVEAIRDIPVGNAIKSLQGRVPGVFITTDGSPSGGATVRIRGVGTLGNNDPLYIIDGVPTKRGLQELNQNDIESIQVLKDASSASIYGSRAANGVIIITTKKAKKGYLRIDADASLSVQYYGTKQKMLDAEGRGLAYWRAAVYDHSDPNINQIYQYDWNGDYDNPVLNKIIYPEFIDAAQTMRPANTHWFDEIARTSIIQQYNATISQGGERGNTLFSMGYYNNQGIVRGSSSSKGTVRLNTDYNFLDGRLKLGENLNLTYIRNALLPISDILFTSMVQQPIVPVHTVDGGWGGPAPGMTDRQNPVRLIEDNRDNFAYFYRIFGNVFADLDIIPGLHFRTNLGLDYAGNYQRTLKKSYVSGFLNDPISLVSTNQDYDGNWLWQNTLTYDLTINKHKINALAGQEVIRYINQRFFGSRQGYAQQTIDYAYLDAGFSNKDNGGGGTSYSLLSWFGKVNYVYDNKYLASATIRRDGSSRFGTAYRYGSFPAFSLGWRISEETFMQNQAVVSELKLRYGWGRTGNQEIANNATYALYSAIYGTDNTFDFERGSAYDIGGIGSGQLPSGFTLIQQGNDSLRWEGTTESNIGIDFGLFNNKLSGSIDYFVKKTKDILISPGYLAVYGEGGNRWFNGASMENKGIDVLVAYNDALSKDLSIGITANISAYKNKVTYLPSDILTAYPGNGTDKTILGRPIGSEFGYIADGIFRSQKEVDDAPEQDGKAVGRIRYRDLDGNNIINDKDRDYIADRNPGLLAGLNIELTYKDLDFSVFFQGVFGNDVYNEFKTYTDFSSIWIGTNWGARALDAWTPDNPNSSIPALTLVDRNNEKPESRASTYFWEKGSYVKCRNIQLGYNLQHLIKSKYIQRARVYIQGSNLFTIKSKSFTAADPEIPGQSFPIPSIGTLGVHVSF